MPDTTGKRITGTRRGSAFDRYDITSEEDLADALRKLEALMGTVSATVANADEDALRDRLTESIEGQGLNDWPGSFERYNGKRLGPPSQSTTVTLA